MLRPPNPAAMGKNTRQFYLGPLEYMYMLFLKVFRVPAGISNDLFWLYSIFFENVECLYGHSLRILFIVYFRTQMHGTAYI